MSDFKSGSQGPNHLYGVKGNESVKVTVPYIPHDIIHQIVTSGPLLPEPEFATDPSTHIPSILAQVSQSWRIVVESIPSLWKDIRFDAMVWNDKAFDPLSNRIMRFSALSQSLQLTLHIDESLYCPNDNEYNCLDNHQPGADPVLFIPDSGLGAKQGLAFPRILRWLLSEWAHRYNAFNLNLSVAHPEILLVVLKEAAAQSLEMPRVTSLTVLKWRWQNGGRRPNQDLLDVYGVPRMLTELYGLWLFDRYGAYTCLARIPDLGQAPILPSDLKCFYLQPSIDTYEWTKTLKHWPSLQAAWYNVRAPRLRGSALPQSRIVHQHIKELNLTVSAPSYSLETLSIPPVFPLFNVHFPSLEVLNLYLKDHSLHDLRFLSTDFGKAFPSLTRLHIGIEWGHTCSLQELEKHCLSLPIPTTLTILISTYDAPQLVNAILMNSKILRLPSHLFLDFYFQPGTTWTSDLDLMLSESILGLYREREPKTTKIRYMYDLSKPEIYEFTDEEDGLGRDDWPDSDSDEPESGSRGDSRYLSFFDLLLGTCDEGDIEYDDDEGSDDEDKDPIDEERRSQMNRENEARVRKHLKRTLACFKNLQSQLGERAVEIDGIKDCSEETHAEQEKNPLKLVGPLKEFRERYFA
ncbi:hypothetical protein BJ165DRAFT_276138 [Panaeolus papilionaceus]|nr:hypothetical protein BJ165DRAFT_276138 [Panaeolus papilionaceus]